MFKIKCEFILDVLAVKKILKYLKIFFNFVIILSLKYILMDKKKYISIFFDFNYFNSIETHYLFITYFVIRKKISINIMSMNFVFLVTTW